jgi:hypothetical protein
MELKSSTARSHHDKPAGSLAAFACPNVNGGGKVQRGAGADGRPKWATPLV